MSKEDRIGCECWYKQYIHEKKEYAYFHGVLRAWVTEGEGTEIYGAAVIERREDGECTTVPVRFVKFHKP